MSSDPIKEAQERLRRLREEQKPQTMTPIGDAAPTEKPWRAFFERKIAEGGDDETPGVKCQKCKDSKWIEHNGAMQRCECVLEGKPRGRALITRYGVGEREADYSFDSFEKRFKDDEMSQKFVTWGRLWSDQANTKRSDLVLAGTNGSGKTGLAIACLRACLDLGGDGWFTELEALAIRWRDTYSRERDRDGSDVGETEADVFDHLTTTDVLVIDELTGTKATDFVEDKLRAIVVARQRAQKPTILTLNVSREVVADRNVDPAKFEREIAVILGPTLFDKLRERAQFFPMFGPSKRQPFRAGKGDR